MFRMTPRLSAPKKLLTMTYEFVRLIPLAEVNFRHPLIVMRKAGQQI